MSKKDDVSTPTVSEAKFNKEQFVKSKGLYSGFERDVFAVVLTDGVLYTKEEAEELKERFMKGEIK